MVGHWAEVKTGWDSIVWRNLSFILLELQLRISRPCSIKASRMLERGSLCWVAVSKITWIPPDPFLALTKTLFLFEEFNVSVSTMSEFWLLDSIFNSSLLSLSSWILLCIYRMYLTVSCMWSHIDRFPYMNHHMLI